MDSRLGEVRRTASRTAPAALAELDRWLRIPSVSGVPAHAGDVDRAARWVADRMRRGGATVRTVRAGAGPLVVGRTRGRGGGTTVVYGHLDVKPAGPGWTTPAFGPTRVGHRLQARGASDDKGQVLAHLTALGAWARTGGPPGDVVTLVDGAEEIGSPGLLPALTRLRHHLAAGPVVGVLVVDTRMAGPGRPSVTLTQRGALALTVRVDVGGRPVHAGRLGGAVVDPSLVLAAALRRAERLLAALPAPGPPYPTEPTAAAVRTAAAGRAVHPDPVRRATRSGVLTVNRLRAGAAAGAVPTRAEAVLDVRVPPGTAPAAVLARLTRELRRGLPPGVRLCVAAGPGDAGSILRPPPAVRAAVDEASRAAFGRPAVTAASGGSIRAVDVLRQVFGQTPVLLGLGPADDGAHGPDEYLDLREWPALVDVHVVALDRLARLGTPQQGQRSDPFTSATVTGSAGSWGPGRAQESSGAR